MAGESLCCVQRAPSDGSPLSPNRPAIWLITPVPTGVISFCNAADTRAPATAEALQIAEESARLPILQTWRKSRRQSPLRIGHLPARAGWTPPLRKLGRADSAMRSPTTTSPVAIPTRTCSGYRRAGEHDAERAVRAGLALVEAAPKLATVAGSPRDCPSRSIAGG
jgi:hypothetical protein